MQKITPCLWFDGQAEEAANFYVGIFKRSRIKKVTHYAEGSPGPTGSVMTVVFELDGQEFMALNGGPEFQFNEAVSFIANCEHQAEVDELWERLSEGGEKVQCGWLKDKYGVSWQVVPTALGDLFSDLDPAREQRVMQALLQMKKIDIEVLKQAAEQAG